MQRWAWPNLSFLSKTSIHPTPTDHTLVSPPPYIPGPLTTVVTFSPHAPLSQAISSGDSRRKKRRRRRDKQRLHSFCPEDHPNFSNFPELKECISFVLPRKLLVTQFFSFSLSLETLSKDFKNFPGAILMCLLFHLGL